MDRSIVDVARMSGVTARTLRHYDHIGLLRPTSIGTDGYRRYDDRALLRLQHILVLRALGLPLAEIGAVLSAERDEIATLREHRDRLLAEQDRLGRMAETVGRTLEELEAQEGNTMTVERPENLFEGFDPSEYEAEARERWPEEAAASAAFTATLTPEDTERMQREFTAHLTRLGELQGAALPVGDAAVQEEIHWLHGSVSRWAHAAGSGAPRSGGPAVSAGRGAGRRRVHGPRADVRRRRAVPQHLRPGRAGPRGVRPRRDGGVRPHPAGLNTSPGSLTVASRD